MSLILQDEFGLSKGGGKGWEGVAPRSGGGGRTARGSGRGGYARDTCVAAQAGRGGLGVFADDS